MADPRECTVLYKILTPAEKQSLPTDSWSGTELDRKDGFIHLSTSEQLAGTLDRFFAKSSNVGDELYILALPRSNIDESLLKFDPAAGTLFGHIYGPINPSKSFTETLHIHRDGNTNRFELAKLPF